MITNSLHCRGAVAARSRALPAFGGVSRLCPGAVCRARKGIAASALAVIGLLAGAGAGADEPSITLKIRNHQFVPAELEIPAGEKRQLVIENEDATPEEFESHTLHREKIIPAQSKTNLFIGPLKPGRYEFIGEFNEASAKGAVVAK